MRQIFVNLPVKDLPKSKAFFAGLGFSFDPKFTDDNAACLKRTSEVLLALSCSSDAYRAFEDPDGHIWELLHMRGDPK